MLETLPNLPNRRILAIRVSNIGKPFPPDTFNEVQTSLQPYPRWYVFSPSRRNEHRPGIPIECNQNSHVRISNLARRSGSFVLARRSGNDGHARNFAAVLRSAGKNQAENQDTKNVKRIPCPVGTNRSTLLSQVFDSIEPWNSQTVEPVELQPVSNFSPSLSLCLCLSLCWRLEQNALDEVADGVLVHGETPAPTRRGRTRALPCSHLV